MNSGILRKIITFIWGQNVWNKLFSFDIYELKKLYHIRVVKCVDTKSRTCFFKSYKLMLVDGFGLDQEKLKLRNGKLAEDLATLSPVPRARVL